ncbi:hypothetical protein [Oceanobacillus jeddahense]|uniref:hypothetical protein n=1 Tax=Oceanobacillus jeddahense TaxID=1462527 RepID=UPI000595E441|nr:hypothetical protein [Oceanobacillus jeddahense]
MLEFFYQTPAIGKSTKEMQLKQGRQVIGFMHIFFRQERVHHPSNDINIEVRSAQTEDIITIEQEAFSFKDGYYKWKVYKNNQEIGEMEAPEGNLLQFQQVNVHIDDFPKISIHEKASGKHVILDEANHPVGETKKANRFHPLKIFKRELEGYISQEHITEITPLFYGVIHTFWCSLRDRY